MAPGECARDSCPQHQLVRGHNSNRRAGYRRLESAHPILRYVNFDNVPVADTFAVKTPNWGVSLVDAPQASMMVAGELGRQRIIWIGFDTLQSLWPYRVSFPMFVANAVDWLNPANAKNAQLVVKPGDPFRLALTHPEKSAIITTPAGATRTIDLDANASELIYGDTFKQGVYRVRLSTNEMMFCSDLLDSAESNTKPRDKLQLGQYTTVAATTTQRTNMELWRTIASIGLIVLMIE